MKAVMLGAGRVGRGFIGVLMRKSGYEVCFVDTDAALVELLNATGAYTLRVVENETYVDEVIDHIRAVDAAEGEEVAKAIAGCDLMATAVGARALPLAAPGIARGLRLRHQMGPRPLNIIICENIPGAGGYLRGLIEPHLSANELEWFRHDVGLVEASVGRMIPVQTQRMRDGDPLRVCAEGYAFLPVDGEALRGGVPPLMGLVPCSAFAQYAQRKLYLHNMSHACCAYFGLYGGHAYIHEAAADPDIHILTMDAMLEASLALSDAHDGPFRTLWDHANDLLHRYSNRALGDTCARVGADIPRKLAPHDRLIGAARLCESQGIPPVNISAGAAAALHRYLLEERQAQTRENAAAALERLSSLSPDETIHALILFFHETFALGAPLRDIRALAANEKHRLAGPVL